MRGFTGRQASETPRAHAICTRKVERLAANQHARLEAELRDRSLAKSSGLLFIIWPASLLKTTREECNGSADRETGKDEELLCAPEMRYELARLAMRRTECLGLGCVTLS